MTETRTLFLLRHAKPVWQTEILTDFERPLSDAGRTEAEAVGRLLLKEKINPDLIVSSPAVRARETIEIVRKKAWLRAGVQYDATIYEASPARLHQVLLSIGPPVSAALIVGHNPGMEALLRLLTRKHREFAPATLAKMTFEVATWNEVTAGSGKFEWLVEPAAN